jgi:hypothetical protein
MRTRKDRKKTAFVPRIVFSAAVAGVGVIPMCVAACGGETTGPGNVGVAATFADGGDAAIFSVGVSFADSGSGRDTAVFGVAVIFADGGDARDSANPPDVEFTVACQCFDGSLGVATDAFVQDDLGFDVADTAFGDASNGREGGGGGDI